MQIFGIGMVLGLAGACMGAPVLWESTSSEANFNTPRPGTLYLKDQQNGWGSYVGNGPALERGELNLQGPAGESARHALDTPSANFKANAASVYVGFTLYFTGADFSAGRTYQKLLEVGMVGLTLAVQGAGNSNGTGVNLRMMLTSFEATEDITVPLNTPVRLLLSMPYTPQGYRRSASLSVVSDAAGTTSYNSVGFGDIASTKLTSLDLFTASSVNAWMDDVMVGNARDAVYIAAHAPEPATVVLSVPVVAGLLMRRRGSR